MEFPLSPQHQSQVAKAVPAPALLVLLVVAEAAVVEAEAAVAEAEAAVVADSPLRLVVAPVIADALPDFGFARLGTAQAFQASQQ